jgi:hypothetical protein
LADQPCASLKVNHFLHSHIRKVASMSVSLLGGALGFGSAADQTVTKDKKAANSPFASLFEAASSQAKRSADKSILHTVLQSQSSSAADAGGGTSAIDLRRDAEAALGNLNRRLQQLFADSDIDTSVDIRLAPNGSGGVELSGSHPDEDKIKEILADHPELVQHFQEMMGLFAKLQASNPSLLGTTPGGMLTMIMSQLNARVALEPEVSPVE